MCCRSGRNEPGGCRRSRQVRYSASPKRIHVMAAIAATLTVGILAYRVLFSFECRFTPESESERDSCEVFDNRSASRATTYARKSSIRRFDALSLDVRGKAWLVRVGARTTGDPSRSLRELLRDRGATRAEK